MSDKRVYKIWRNILTCCGSPKYPTYLKCEICVAWLNFKNFYSWYKENYYTVNDEKMCVNKDILVKGNKLYSPKTCCIVPETINMLFSNRKHYCGELPVGVTFKDSKYMAKFKRNGHDFYLGCHDNVNDAFTNYKYAKEYYIKTVAKKYHAWIPQRVYDALMNYKIEITD